MSEYHPAAPQKWTPVTSLYVGALVNVTAVYGGQTEEFKGVVVRYSSDRVYVRPWGTQGVWPYNRGQVSLIG